MASQTRFSQRARIALISILMGVILVLPSGLVGAAPPPPAQGEESLFGRATPLADLLNPDGTLNTPGGFEGSLDPAGWRLVSELGAAPRFAPAAPLAASDINWDDRFYPRGTSDNVYALVWGGGDLYVGGSFTAAGAVAANRIAKWDGSSWSALGTGMNGAIFALAWDGSNPSTGSELALSAVKGQALYAGGIFTTAGGAAAKYIAKWDGASWSALGTGMNNYVYTLAWDGSNLYAGGMFTTAGGAAANYIAKWDGSSWSALGTGMDWIVEALAWDGSNPSTGSELALSAVKGQALYAGGYFTTAGGVAANYIARWDGTNWSALGTGMNDYVYALVWDGSNPSLSSGQAPSAGLRQAQPGSSGQVLYAGGDFTTAGGVTANHVARWDGANWSALGTGMGNDIETLAWDGSNPSAGSELALSAVKGQALYAGGWFTTAGGAAASRIAKWDGANWSALGTGVNSTVMALAWDGSNPSAGSELALSAVKGQALYAGGYFTTAGGAAARRIARWDGCNWSALGSGMDYAVLALAWDGSNPSAGSELALSAVKGQALYAGGEFGTASEKASSHIARWRGAALWDGGGGDNNWSTAANWYGDIVPEASNTVVFGEFSGKDAVLDAAFTGQVGGVVVKPAYAGTVTMNRSLQVSGNLVLQGGAFVQGDHNLTVSCCFSQAGGTFTGGAGTLTIGNAFDLSGGVFTAPSGNSMTVAGNWTYSGGTFSHNSGTVIFNGSGTQNLALDAATTFYNLTVNSGVTLVETVAADNATVSGTLTNNGVIRKSQSISTTGARTFGLTGVQMDVTTLGTLSSVQVDRRDSHHPNATTGLQTGRYWMITPTGNGYTVDLTLPTAFTPDDQDKVCRYTGSGQVWDCAMSSSTSNSITRDGVTQLSDWAAGNDVGPNAVTLRGLTARSGGLVGG